MRNLIFHTAVVVGLTLSHFSAAAVAGNALTDSAVGKGLEFLGNNRKPDNVLPATHEPEILKDAELKPLLGERLPLQAKLTDHNGKQVKLGDYFKGEMPTIITMGYYKCPMLCDLVLNAMIDGIKGAGLKMGEDYQIVTMTISPKEGTDLAKQKRATYLKALGKTEAAKGWAFHTASKESIDKVSKALGFGFNEDAQSGDFAHGAGIYIATPDGVLNNALFGLIFESKDIRFALLEAGKGKIGQLLDRIVLSCFQYNAEVGKYTVYVWGLMRLAAIVTVLLLLLILIVMWRSERKTTASA